MNKNILTGHSEDISGSVPDLKTRFWAFYWAVPLLTIIPFAFLYGFWPSDRTGIIILYTLLIFVIWCRYRWVFRKMKHDLKAGEALVYTGKITDAKLLTKKKSIRTEKKLLIKIEKDGQTADIVLWQNKNTPFFEQDDTLQFRYQELTGWLITIKLLPQSKTILSYEIENENKQILTSWGNTYLTILSSTIRSDGNHQLPKDKVDYIYFKRNTSQAYFILDLSSDSEYTILQIPSFLPNFSELEAWMSTLPDFDEDFYHSFKTDTNKKERSLLWERTYKIGVPQNSAYAGMKFMHIGSELTAICNNGATEQIKERDIELITIRSFAESHSYADYEVTLHGFATASLSVRSRAENFNELLEFMYNLPGFDKANFKSLAMRLTETPLLVWKAKPPLNAYLETRSQSASDYLIVLENGIPIENKGLTIKWADFQTLENSGVARQYTIPSPNTDYYSFLYELKDVVILNGLQLNKLAFTSPTILRHEQLNKSWPLENAYANIALGLEGTENYERVKEHLTTIFDKMPRLNESETYLEAYWLQGKLKIGIQTWQPYLVNTFFNYCQLTLERKPDVRKFFEDDYVRHFKLNDAIEYRIFDATLSIQADYKNNQFVRNMPQVFSDKLPDEHQFVIWIDHAKNIIAIGNKEYAYIQSLKKHLGWLAVGYFWRDIPSELNLYFNKISWKDSTEPENKIGWFDLSDEIAWRKLLDAISKFVPFRCNYIEDRQYY